MEPSQYKKQKNTKNKKILLQRNQLELLVKIST